MTIRRIVNPPSPIPLQLLDGVKKEKKKFKTQKRGAIHSFLVDCMEQLNISSIIKKPSASGQRKGRDTNTENNSQWPVSKNRNEVSPEVFSTQTNDYDGFFNFVSLSMTSPKRIDEYTVANSTLGRAKIGKTACHFSIGKRKGRDFHVITTQQEWFPGSRNINENMAFAMKYIKPEKYYPKICKLFQFQSLLRLHFIRLVLYFGSKENILKGNLLEGESVETRRSICDSILPFFVDSISEVVESRNEDLIPIFMLPFCLPRMVGDVWKIVHGKLDLKGPSGTRILARLCSVDEELTCGLRLTKGNDMKLKKMIIIVRGIRVQVHLVRILLKRHEKESHSALPLDMGWVTGVEKPHMIGEIVGCLRKNPLPGLNFSEF